MRPSEPIHLSPALGCFRSSQGSSSPFGVIGPWPVCLLGASGTPWKSRIVRDRAASARLLPPEPRRGDDPRSPPRRGSSFSREFPVHRHQRADSAGGRAGSRGLAPGGIFLAEWCKSHLFG